MRFLMGALATLVILVVAAGAQADDALPDCNDPLLADDFEPPCTMNWIENQTLQRLIWWQGAEGYSIAEEQDIELNVEADGSYKAISQRRPYLMDIDQDGWTDLIFFTQIGMVNGDFVFFRFDPIRDKFVAMGDMNGAHFNLDKTGFVVAVARTSCCESGAYFYKIEEHQLALQFHMDIRPSEMSGPTEQCQIWQGFEGVRADALREDYPDLITDYCNYYEEGGWKAIEARSLDQDVFSAAVHRVPEDTVFYCQLDDETHEVGVTYRDGIYRYQYGTVGQAPDLEIRHEASQVKVLPDNGAGPSRFGYVEFQNEGYFYRVHYGYEIEFGDNSADVSETIRGLTVRRGNEATYVFDKDCLRNASFDQIFLLEKLD